MNKNVVMGTELIKTWDCFRHMDNCVCDFSEPKAVIDARCKEKFKSVSSGYCDVIQKRYEYGIQLQESITKCMDVMIEGELTHKKDEWKSTEIHVHMDHAKQHLNRMSSFDSVDKQIEEASHAATRALMVVQRLIEDLDKKK